MDNTIIEIIPAVRMILSKGKHPGSAKFIPANNELLSELNKKYPDVTLLLKKKDYGRFIQKIQDSTASRSFYVNYIGLEDQGLIAFGENKTQADYLEEFFIQWTKGNKEPLIIPSQTENRRVEQKIVVVTGGAMGFGGGIVEEMHKEGANIVIADINEEKGMEMAQQLNRTHSSNAALCIETDVSDPVSVEQMVQKTVLEFGGIDVIISNAGILRAGSLEEMDPQTFELMTKVNYTGYFYCAKYASAIMKIQSRYSSNMYFDIIQINSKSGLKGSNKNFTYAGGKFGGIGLTQSFALELMPCRIKVNSICPGNFFDGPLWSDPENGLLVQYLKAGKVHGAKTIEDVKKHYEQQVPAGRGCRVIDIVRAIFYVMEQEYETGQAVPVTGGQNMLN